MKLKPILLTLAVFLFMTGSSQAQFYLGGAIANGFQNHNLFNDLSKEDFRVKSNGFAWKAFAGVQLGFIGLEGGYRDFGRVTEEISGQELDIRSRGWDVMARGQFKIAIVRLFGKAGVYFENNQYESMSVIESFQDTNTRFGWGLGGGLQLGMIMVRLEYENFHISSGNLGMLSLGASLHLGNR